MHLWISLNIQYIESWSRWATAAKKYKNFAWSDASWFLLRYSYGKSRIWRNQQESISILPCINSSDGGSVILWGNIFKAYIGTFVTNKISFKCLSLFGLMYTHDESGKFYKQESLSGFERFELRWERGTPFATKRILLLSQITRPQKSSIGWYLASL